MWMREGSWNLAPAIYICTPWGWNILKKGLWSLNGILTRWLDDQGCDESDVQWLKMGFMKKSINHPYEKDLGGQGHFIEINAIDNDVLKQSSDRFLIDCINIA